MLGDPMRPDRLARRILALLQDEADAIVIGNYDKLAQISALRERLFTALEQRAARDAPDDLEYLILSIKREAERNRDLLQAALRGVADAKKLVARLREGRRNLGVYTESGERIRNDLGDGDLERRL